MPHRPLRPGEMTDTELQSIMAGALSGGAIFMGFLKPRCLDLHDENGFKTGERTQPGDVFDTYEDFLKYKRAGVYRLADEKPN